MVRITTYVNTLLVHEEIVSSANVEYFFVKNAIKHVNENLNSSTSHAGLYKNYVKSIAILDHDIDENNVIKKVEKWINKTFKDNTKKEVCIECNNKKEWISM